MAQAYWVEAVTASTGAVTSYKVWRGSTVHAGCEVIHEFSADEAAGGPRVAEYLALLLRSDLEKGVE